VATLKGAPEELAQEFLRMVEAYVTRRWGGTREA
jgi:hypothetical protein